MSHNAVYLFCLHPLCAREVFVSSLFILYVWQRLHGSLRFINKPTNAEFLVVLTLSPLSLIIRYK